MATAVDDTYSAASGETIYGGREAPQPAWRQGRAPLVWAEIEASNVLQDLDPGDDPLLNADYPDRPVWALKADGGLTNQRNLSGMIIPWCGGAWDEALKRFLTGIGGGHGDRGGNDGYGLNAGLDVPAWWRASLPSGALPLITGGLPVGSTAQNNSFLLDDGQETSGVYADGRPRAIHNYRKHVFVPGVGLVLVRQGGTFSGTGGSTKWTWLFNESMQEWEHKSTPSDTSYRGDANGASAYDPSRGCVYWVGSALSRVSRIDLDTWAWSFVSTNSKNDGGQDVCITYIEEFDVLFYVCSSATNDFSVFDCATGVWTSPTTTGTAPNIDGAMGQSWVPGVGMVIHTSNAGMHVLAPTGNPRTDPWEWSELAVSGTPPEAIHSGGFYERCHYSRGLKGFYRIHSHNENPWFLPLE